MEPIYEHPIVVRFKASTTSGLPWKFTPCQESIIGNVIDQSSKRVLFKMVRKLLNRARESDIDFAYVKPSKMESL